MAKIQNHLPKHVGLIMDGNGRWATNRMLPRNAGHKKGADVFEKIVQHALNIGIKHLTVFAFSTENFSRPDDEVEAIIGLMRNYLKNQKKHQNKDIRVMFLGDINILPKDMISDIRLLEENSEQYSQLHLNIAFNYGGRQDILQAGKKLANLYKNREIISLDEFDESDFSNLLYTQNQPEVDLLIRTSGEERISNFLLWQCAYAEFVFSPILWPDFSPKDFDDTISVFNNRHRRRGGL